MLPYLSNILADVLTRSLIEPTLERIAVEKEDRIGFFQEGGYLVRALVVFRPNGPTETFDGTKSVTLNLMSLAPVRTDLARPYAKATCAAKKAVPLLPILDSVRGKRHRSISRVRVHVRARARVWDPSREESLYEKCLSSQRNTATCRGHLYAALYIFLATSRRTRRVGRGRAGKAFSLPSCYGVASNRDR